MVAIAATPPLVAAGPPGWVVFGVLVAATAIVSAVEIMKADEEADDIFADDEPTGVQSCPEESCSDKTSPAEGKDKSGELPENPDDLLEDGYEETTHPNAQKQGIRTFHNPKTGDEVEFHKGRPNETGWKAKDHWHRYNPNTTGKRDLYLDRNGNPVPKGSDESHIEPGK